MSHEPLKYEATTPPSADTGAVGGAKNAAWPEPPTGTGTYSGLWVKAKDACDAYPLQPAELEEIMGFINVFDADKKNAAQFGWASLRWMRRLLKDVVYSRMLNAGLMDLHSTDEWPMAHAEAMMRVAGAEAARKQAESEAAALRAKLAEEGEQERALLQRDEELRGLRAAHAERGKQLYAALLSLADMWDQYCPPPHTHMFMSAGEDAADLLDAWGLLPNGEFAEAINSYDGTPMPEKVQALLAPNPTAAPLPKAQGKEGDRV